MLNVNRGCVALIALCFSLLAQAQDHDATRCPIRGSYRSFKLGIEAFEALKHAAEQGDVEAQFCLGMRPAYDRESNVAHDYVEAVRWLRKAAEQGHARAQYEFAMLYRDGRRGIAKNSAEAVKWHRKAAEQGYARAQYTFGLMHLERTGFYSGITKSDAEAERWFRMAAEQNDTESRYDVSSRHELGMMYLKDPNVARSDAEAIQWLRTMNGNVQALFVLGTMYEEGRGVARNKAEAAKLYCWAATGWTGNFARLAELALQRMGEADRCREQNEAARKRAEEMKNWDWCGTGRLLDTTRQPKRAAE